MILGQNDARHTSQHPNHPLRLLTELATPEPLKPVPYIEAVVDFMLSLIPDDENWAGSFTPFDVLEGALATEGHTSSATRRAITFGAYGVNHDAVRAVRNRIIDAILDSLTSGTQRRAYNAAIALQAATHGPMGLLNRNPSAAERDEWSKEFVETLERVNDVLDRTVLPPVILLRIASSVHWHAHYGQGVTRAPAARILDRLDRDLETRVTRVLIDGWGTNTWDHPDGWQDRNEAIQCDLANEVVAAFPRAPDLVAFINARLVEMRS